MIPTAKISATVLDFGEPILGELPENATKEDFEAAMLLVITVWNVVVLDMWNKTSKCEKDFFEALKPGPKEAFSVMEKLIQRKKSEYSSDLRAVGHHSVIEKNGDFLFRAEARMVSKVLKSLTGRG